MNKIFILDACALISLLNAEDGSIALAEASVSKGSLITSDHHEFDLIEKTESEKINFTWIR